MPSQEILLDDRPSRRSFSRQARVAIAAATIIFVVGAGYVAYLARFVSGPELVISSGSHADWIRDSDNPPSFARYAGYDPAGRYLALLDWSSSGDITTVLFDTTGNAPLRVGAAPSEARAAEGIQVIRANQWTPDGLFVEIWFTERFRQLPSFYRGLAQSLAGNATTMSQHWRFDSLEQTLLPATKLTRGSHDRMISPDGKQTDEVADYWRPWCADSRHRFRIRHGEWALLDSATDEVLWAKSDEVLQRETFGDLGGDPDVPPEFGMPGVFIGGIVHRDDDTALRVFVFRAKPDSPDEAVMEHWEFAVPGLEWKLLAAGNNLCLDPAGMFAIAFEGGPEGLRIERVDSATQTRELLYAGTAPAPWPGKPGWHGVIDYTCVLPHPRRVYWMTEEKELWLLRLDEQAAMPRRVWPPQTPSLEQD